MPELSTKALELRDFDNRGRTTGTLTIRHFTPGQRAWRAGKLFAIFFALALFSVFIPVLHFVLVPAFCLIATACAMFYAMQDRAVEIAEGICPYCGKTTLLPKAQFEGEFRDSCQQCFQLMVIKPIS